MGPQPKDWQNTEAGFEGLFLLEQIMALFNNSDLERRFVINDSGVRVLVLRFLKTNPRVGKTWMRRENLESGLCYSY